MKASEGFSSRVVLATGLLASAGALAADRLPQSALANTQWRLVEFQSMDDAQGTTRPSDSSLYTMRLDADGTVSLRLNCNRATGTWSAKPSSDPGNGQFSIGPLAVTRALCPPPSMDESIARQSSYINIDETGIGTTSAVGCFPDGASPHGVQDLSGNVWEWTRSLDRNYPYNPGDGRENLAAPSGEARVRRGGSFSSNSGLARCAFRVRNLPNYGYDYVGLRCVLSLWAERSSA